MKVLISPAKSLDYSSAIPCEVESTPVFLEESSVINEVLRQKSPKDILELMKVSSNLADLNWERNQKRSLKKTAANAGEFRQAIYAFNGDVYTGLDAYTLSADRIMALQDKLRILSGLYGLLKPLDAIEPYRLEMGTKMPIGEHPNLYGYWKPILTEALNSEMQEGELLVNLASNEYFSAIDKKKVIGKLITPEFKELRDGKLKTISFFAKKARGMMVRYIVDRDINDIEGLKGFNLDGYALSESESSKTNLVFTR